MQLPVALSLALGVLASASGTSDNTTPFANRKRQLLSCEETYGEGSVQCGPPDSAFCYNPSLGQTCCLTDFGFCEAGSYCAPVAGTCCMDSETVEDCAEAAGFEIPSSLLPTTTMTATVVLPSKTTPDVIPEPTLTPAVSIPGAATTDMAPTTMMMPPYPTHWNGSDIPAVVTAASTRVESSLVSFISALSALCLGFALF